MVSVLSCTLYQQVPPTLPSHVGYLFLSVSNRSTFMFDGEPLGAQALATSAALVSHRHTRAVQTPSSHPTVIWVSLAFVLASYELFLLGETEHLLSRWASLPRPPPSPPLLVRHVAKPPPAPCRGREYARAGIRVAEGKLSSPTQIRVIFQLERHSHRTQI